jgi:hypothetical protein
MLGVVENWNVGCITAIGCSWVWPPVGSVTSSFVSIDWDKPFSFCVFRGLPLFLPDDAVVTDLSLS